MLIFNNPWMHIESNNGRQFICSMKERFAVTLVSSDAVEVNNHCIQHNDRGVIAIDQDGLFYVALFVAEDGAEYGH